MCFITCREANPVKLLPDDVDRHGTSHLGCLGSGCEESVYLHEAQIPKQWPAANDLRYQELREAMMCT